MYPHFIEIHAREDGAELMINIDNIIGLGGGTHDRIAIRMIDNSRWIPRETYDEVKKLIKDAGALINKGDTRIDTQRRLTMQDLQGMVGEPVWSSNTNTWLLVYDGDWTYSGDPDRVCVRVVNRYGCKDIWLSEEDLIAKPLYRMKAG